MAEEDRVGQKRVITPSDDDERRTRTRMRAKQDPCSLRDSDDHNDNSGCELIGVTQTLGELGHINERLSYLRRSELHHGCFKNSWCDRRNPNSSTSKVAGDG